MNGRIINTLIHKFFDYVGHVSERLLPIFSLVSDWHLQLLCDDLMIINPLLS